MSDFDKQYNELNASLKSIGDQIKSQAETSNKEIARHGEMNTETRAKVDELLMKQGELQARLDAANARLAELGQAQRQWEDIPDAVRPRVLFVSVDPERDTPERAGEYAAAFHGDTLAATADIPALEAFTRSLSLVFMKVPGPDGAAANQYTIDPSAALAVLDPQARMAGVISPPFDPAEIAADLRLLTGSR